MKKELLIFGKISIGNEIFEVADSHYKNSYDHIQTLLFNESFIEENNLSEKINNNNYELNYIIGFTDINKRIECVDRLSQISNFKPATVINPAAYIAKSAVIGKGCYIGANASISTNAVINDHVIINLNSSIGHDVKLEEHVIVMPGARISGNVLVGEGSLIGANAFIYQKVIVGKNNLIDALTYVKNDLPENMVSTSRNTKTFKRVL